MNLIPFRRRRPDLRVVPPAPPEVVEDGAGELGIRGRGAYSFTLRPDLEAPARLAEVLPIDALVRQLEELEEP